MSYWKNRKIYKLKIKLARISAEIDALAPVIKRFDKGSLFIIREYTNMQGKKGALEKELELLEGEIK